MSFDSPRWFRLKEEKKLNWIYLKEKSDPDTQNRFFLCIIPFNLLLFHMILIEKKWVREIILGFAECILVWINSAGKGNFSKFLIGRMTNLLMTDEHAIDNLLAIRLTRLEYNVWVTSSSDIHFELPKFNLLPATHNEEGHLVNFYERTLLLVNTLSVHRRLTLEIQGGAWSYHTGVYPEINYFMLF